MMGTEYYVGQLTYYILLAIYLIESTINLNTYKENDVYAVKRRQACLLKLLLQL